MDIRTGETNGRLDRDMQPPQRPRWKIVLPKSQPFMRFHDSISTLASKTLAEKQGSENGGQPPKCSVSGSL